MARGGSGCGFRVDCLIFQPPAAGGGARLGACTRKAWGEGISASAAGTASDTAAQAAVGAAAVDEIGASKDAWEALKDAPEGAVPAAVGNSIRSGGRASAGMEAEPAAGPAAKTGASEGSEAAAAEGGIEAAGCDEHFAEGSCRAAPAPGAETGGVGLGAYKRAGGLTGSVLPSFFTARLSFACFNFLSPQSTRVRFKSESGLKMGKHQLE